MQYVDSGPLGFLIAGAWLAGWVLAFHGMGVLVLGSALPRKTAVEYLLFKCYSVALGMLGLSVWTFAWGMAGFLNRGTVLVYFLAGLFACAWDKRRRMKDEFRAMRAGWAGVRPLEKVVILVLLALMVLSFVGAQAPPTGNDELAYHLYFPRLYVEDAKVIYDPTHSRSAWPFFMEMLYAVGLLLQGASLAKLFSWLTAVLSIILVPCVAHFFFRDRRVTTASLLLMMATPAIWMQALYAYVDNAVMLYSFLSFVALWIWKESGYRSRQGVIAGLCLASLLSIKIYSIIPFLILVLLFGPFVLLRGISAREKVRALSVLGLTVLACAGCWYIRSWIYTGNPVFPFMADFFGGRGFANRLEGFAVLPKTWINFLLIPWNITFRVDVFGGEPLGCLFLAALPVLVLFSFPRGMARYALLFVILYVTIWFFTIQHVRFLFPALPFLSLVLAVGIPRVLSEMNRWRRILLVTAGLLMLLHLGLCVYYPLRVLGGALGMVSADRYLRTRERTYAFLKSMDQEFMPGDKALVLGEPRLFYFPVAVVYMNPKILWDCRREGLDLKEWVRRAGITHLLVRTITPKEDLLERNPDWAALVPQRGQPEVHRRISVGGEEFDYRLWKLE